MLLKSYPKKMTTFVFVYGTLKKDEPNYHWLTNVENGKATFVHRGQTVVKYPLVISSRYNIPFLLDSPGIGKNIIGELYEIDDNMLKNLDVLEECPNLYIRRLEKITYYNTDKVQVQENPEEPKVVEAWTYFLPKFRPDLLNLEYLESYASDGPHNKPHVARYLREKKVDHRFEVKQNV